MTAAEVTRLERVERPLSVTLFETLSVAVLAFEMMFASGFSWEDLIWVPLMLWIILSVTRGKSSTGRWIFSALHVCGFLLMIYLLSRGLLRHSGITWPALVVTLASVPQLILLWSPTTSKWLASRRRSSPPKAHV